MTPHEPDQGLDLGSLLAQLSQVQQGLQEAQEAVNAQVVEGSAGGGAVRVRLTGGLDFESVTISPEVVDPSDVAMLQDLVLAAIRDAIEKVLAAQRDAFGGVGGAVLGQLGGLGGLLGGPGGPGGE